MASTLPWRRLLTIWGVAALLSLIGLGDLPLRDFDEATVARVALEFHRGQGDAPLLPTLWGEPYLNKAPGLHLVIAAVIGLTTSQGLPSEWSIRIAPALLSSLVVPLGGLLQWQLRPGDQSSTLSTSAILLTLLPIARHGRLAMLDGTQLSLTALLWLGLLHLQRTRQPSLVSLITGLAASGMLLLKAPLLLPAAAAGALAVVWGREWRTWSLIPASGAFLAGLVPGVSWHAWHAYQRGPSALWLWGGDGAGRVLLDAGEGSDLGWRVPVIEMLEGGWPWLVLFPIALIWAWRFRRSRWGRWTVSTLVILMASILPLRTQLPWYSHSLWLPVALLCGPLLAWMVTRRNRPDRAVPMHTVLRRIPQLWSLMGALLIMTWVVSLTPLGSDLADYRPQAIALGVGWVAGGWWLTSDRLNRRRLGAICMVCGNVGALALMFSSPLWLWELNESWSVQPVAALTTLDQSSDIRLRGYDERPSLNWYAERRIQRHQSNEALRLSDQPQQHCRILGRAGEWTLADCDNMTRKD